MRKVAAIQMCSSFDVNKNLESASELIAAAAAQHAELIVLPENFALMALDEKAKLAAKESYGSGIIQSFLAEQAKKHHIWILGGTIPIASDQSNKIRAASILYNEHGKVVARYDKIHLFDVKISTQEIYQESATIEPGNKLVIVDTPVGKLGLGVCYDIRYPEMFRYLFNQGIEIIALPSAFTVKTGSAHWEILCRSRAIENFSYLIGAAQGGTHANGRKTYGHSLIVSPWGNVLSQKNDSDPGVIDAEIDLTMLHELRQSIPISDHQKIFFDVSKL